MIPAGALGDRYGRRGALLVGLTIFGAGSAAAAMSGSADALIACRAAMGVGAALVVPATLSILTAVFPAGERAQAIGAWSAVAGIGIVVGPTLGGLLLAHFYWGAVFWVNVPLVAVALAAVAVIVPALPGQRSGHRLDVAGGALSAFSMLAIVDSVIEAPNRGWLSRWTVAEFILGVLLFAGFIARELTAANPLIDVRVFRHRAFSAATAAVGLTFFALFGALFALTQYLQLVHGYSALAAGIRALPFAVGVMVAAPTSAILVRRLGVRMVLPAGLTAMGTGLLLLTQVSSTTGYPYLALAITIMGTGMGLVLAPAGESIMSTLPPAQTGVGSAMNDTVQELGGSLGVAVVGSVVSAAFRHSMDNSGLPRAILVHARTSIAAADETAARSGPLAAQVSDVAHQSFTSAMTTGFTVAAVTALVGAIVVAIALPGRRASLRIEVSDREPMALTAG